MKKLIPNIEALIESLKRLLSSSKPYQQKIIPYAMQEYLLHADLLKQDSDVESLLLDKSLSYDCKKELFELKLRLNPIFPLKSLEAFLKPFPSRRFRHSMILAYLNKLDALNLEIAHQLLYLAASLQEGCCLILGSQISTTGRDTLSKEGVNFYLIDKKRIKYVNDQGESEKVSLIEGQRSEDFFATLDLNEDRIATAKDLQTIYSYTHHNPAKQAGWDARENIAKTIISRLIEEKLLDPSQKLFNLLENLEKLDQENRSLVRETLINMKIIDEELFPANLAALLLLDTPTDWKNKNYPARFFTLPRENISPQTSLTLDPETHTIGFL